LPNCSGRLDLVFLGALNMWVTDGCRAPTLTTFAAWCCDVNMVGVARHVIQDSVAPKLQQRNIVPR
jgi:hypothetical protein